MKVYELISHLSTMPAGAEIKVKLQVTQEELNEAPQEFEVSSFYRDITSVQDISEREIYLQTE